MKIELSKSESTNLESLVYAIALSLCSFIYGGLGMIYTLGIEGVMDVNYDVLVLALMIPVCPTCVIVYWILVQKPRGVKQHED